MFAINIAKKFPEPLRTRALFRLGIWSTPMMSYIRPKLVELTDDKAVIRVNLSSRTRNPFNSMFFGAIATGSDCVAGMFAMKFMIETGQRVLPFVGAARSEYLKKVKSYAHFTCSQGREITEACKRSLVTGQRQDVEVHVTVTAPIDSGDEPVARITHGLSIRGLH